MSIYHLFWILPLAFSMGYFTACFLIGGRAGEEADDAICRERANGMPRDRPGEFYHILQNEDGTVDVYLFPSGSVYHTDMGICEYDIDARVMRGIIPWDNMEDDIRKRYYEWYDSAEVVDF